MSKILLYNFETNDYAAVLKNKNECRCLINDYCFNLKSKIYKRSDKKFRKPFGFCNVCPSFQKEVSER